ncbi:hypothetical protein M5X00_04310 [Paenibacillus alvei]|uniref:hypothetical protein n=2 Tax=Paenibacillus alvei TaxID=44250 RepID=UPI00227E0F03|nr:hypothetical protein [Paenibacillus alvei]MCY9705824.1 hypothetical protein [Paenibacillus alvei]MCY9753481.1 hypothetical protein [Paenibacillus alvei]
MRKHRERFVWESVMLLSDKGEKSMWVTALMLTLYSFVCGSLVGMYAFLTFPVNLVCSVGALYLGYRFFKRYETKGVRIWFVSLSVLFYFIFLFMMSVVTYMKQMPAPAV